MAHNTRAWRQSPRSVSALGLLIVAGLLAVVCTATPAQDPPKPTQGVPANITKAAPAPASAAGDDKAEMVKFINDKLEVEWQKNKIRPADACTDYEFIRRASLDVIGRIARPEEIDHFLKDPKDTRRSLLIDRLLKSEDYARNWANLWANWLLTRSGNFGRGMYHDQMHVWLEDQFAQNRRYHEFVRDLITAKGKNSDNGAVNFILAHLGDSTTLPGMRGGPAANRKRAEEGAYEMVPITSRITRLFLSVQTQCVQCHDHPFDANLKQQQFWGVNVFLRQLDREGNPPMRRRDTAEPLTLKEDNALNSSGVVFYEKRSGVIMQTKAVFIDGAKMSSGVSRRETLTEMVINHDNFPKAIVNRMWAHFMGRGFTNPIDDFQEQNQPSIPELLDELANKFKHYGYNQQDLIRWICNSRAYSLKCEVNPTNQKAEAEPLFSRMIMKPMTPEQLFESLMVATNAEAAETKETKRNLRDSWMNKLITNFGDDEGNEVNFNGTIVQALMMMNGQDINTAISGKKATVQRILARGMSASGNVNQLFLAALNRPATQAEISKLVSQMPLARSRDKEASAPWQDLMWALLNSNEFLLNH